MEINIGEGGIENRDISFKTELVPAGNDCHDK